MDDHRPNKRVRLTEDAASDDHPQRIIRDPVSSSINISGNSRVQIGDQYTYNVPATDRVQELMKELSDSLTFPEIWNRYTAIGDEHEGTCNWALGSTLRVTSDLVDSATRNRLSPYIGWLISDQPVFWISGKPGSGKSVLMRYLHKNLIDSENSETIFLLSFWFWEAGTKLEQSLVGCLRSLLLQCIQSSFGRDILAEHEVEIRRLRSWTKRNLTKALNLCLTFIQARGATIRVFLDGIDESGSDAHEVLDLVEQLTIHLSTIKLCVSSRPEQFLVESLSQYPALRVQDFNTEDINKVIDEDLFHKPVICRLLRGRADEADTLKLLIRNKAQGVFLWVKLAIRDILRGITNRDDFDTLEQRLERLPIDLDSLYASMLSRNENDLENYRQVAALYLNLALHRSFTLTQFCLATDHRLRRKLHDEANWTLEIVENSIRWEDTKAWVNARSGGLLEIPYEELDMYKPFSTPCTRSLMSYHPLALHRIEFIHRTARTYLLTTTTGSDLLAESESERMPLTDICREVDLIFYFVLPTLFRCHPSHSYDDRDWFLCHKCDNQSESMYRCARRIFDSLARRGCLDREETWVPRHHDRRFYPFPSLIDGTIDYPRLLCRMDWLTLVPQAIRDASRPVDGQYASVLMLEVYTYHCDIGFFRHLYERERKPRKKPFALLKFFKERGANLHTLVPCPNSDSTTFLRLLVLLALGQLQRFDPETVAFIASIAPVDEDDKSRFRWSIESVGKLIAQNDSSSEIFFLGDYNLDDYDTIVGSKSEDREVERASRIFVALGRRQSGGMYGVLSISDDASKMLMMHLKTLGKQGGCLTYGPGIIQVTNFRRSTVPGDETNASKERIYSFLESLDAAENEKFLVSDKSTEELSWGQDEHRRSLFRNSVNYLGSFSALAADLRAYRTGTELGV